MDQLGLLISFAAVVEHGSFTGASKHLGKTKGIVSRQVNQLEALLDVRLLNRTTRAIAITEQGRDVYDRARHIIDEMKQLERLRHNNDQQLSGRLRISAPQTFGEINVMGCLTSFMQQHPDLKVELQLSDHYIDIVNEGFDLAIRIGQLEDSNLIAKKIGELEQILVASPALLAQHPTITTPNELSALPCIHDSNRRDGSKWTFYHQAPASSHAMNNTTTTKESYSVKINPILSVNSASAVARAVQQGLGISLLPSFAIQSALDAGTLVPLLPDYSSNNAGVYALYPHRQYLTQKVKVFIEHLEHSWRNSNRITRGER